MRNHLKLLFVSLALAGWFFPQPAQAKGQFEAGVVLWTHETPMNVESATDFDGTDDTAGEQLKDWDVLGSGLGMRLTYGFPRLVAVYGELGSAQMNVREEDVTDPNQDVETLGLDDDLYFVLGARAEGTFTDQGRAFWSAGVASTSISADVHENVNVTRDYDERITVIDGKAGIRHRNVRYYAGLRFVRSSLDLEETDLTEIPGQQVRMIELERDGELDLAIGAQGKGENVTGFIELDVIGTRSLTSGLSLRF